MQSSTSLDVGCYFGIVGVGGDSGDIESAPSCGGPEFAADFGDGLQQPLLTVFSGRHDRRPQPPAAERKMLALPPEYDSSLRVIAADRNVVAPKRGQPVDLVRKNQDLLPPADVLQSLQEGQARAFARSDCWDCLRSSRCCTMWGATQEGAAAFPVATGGHPRWLAGRRRTGRLEQPGLGLIAHP